MSWATPRSPEERLVLAALRAPGGGVAATEPVSWEQTGALLDRLRLRELLGPRLVGAPAWFVAEVARARADRAQDAALHELLLLRVLSVLDAAGIVAAPIKGVTLAAEAHADLAARPGRDLDVLVAADALERAAEVVAAAGWQSPGDHRDAAGRPLLHLSLAGRGGVPRVELHWRVHWWEDAFCARALARARPADLGVRLTVEDHVAVVLLNYARDGLMGVRHPADLLALATRTGRVFDLDPELTASPLGPALGVAVVAAEQVAGRPLFGSAPRGPQGARARSVFTLADPFLRGTDSQIGADVSLADVLLAPSGGVRRALRRQLVPPDPELLLERPALVAAGSSRLARARLERGARMLRRYGMAGGRVLRGAARAAPGTD